MQRSQNDRNIDLIFTFITGKLLSNSLDCLQDHISDIVTTGFETIFLQKLLFIFLANLPCPGVIGPIREGILPEFLCLLLFFRQDDLGKVSRKKVAVLLDFVQMRGGGPAQICVRFSQTVYSGQFGDGDVRGGPLPKFFFAHWRSKKVAKVVQILGRGGGGRGNLDKIQKNSYFFS